MELKTLTMPFDFDATHPLHLEVADCSDMGRAFATKAQCCSVGQWSLRTFRHNTIGSYLVEITGHLVFTSSNVRDEITRLSALNTPPTSVDLVIAPEHYHQHNDRLPLTHLRVVDLQRIHALKNEGVTTAQYQAMLDAHGIDPLDDGVDNYVPHLPTPSDPDPHIVFHVS